MTDTHDINSRYPMVIRDLERQLDVVRALHGLQFSAGIMTTSIIVLVTHAAVITLIASAVIIGYYAIVAALR
jgi:hypothetical protein